MSASVGTLENFEANKMAVPRREANAQKTAFYAGPGRIEAIDLARGFAVALMILSHGVKGLLTFEQIPSWGLVPIHLLTKFSSSLFILVFGVSLAVAFLPFVGTSAWPRKRQKLLFRGLLVLFWYKALTIVEMFHLYSREDILKTLLYQAFPVYVEILGFYAIALIWVPLILPIWKRLHLSVKITVPIALALLSNWLFLNFDFWGNESLKALLVEHDRHYTWGQLARAPLIFLGLLIGEAVTRTYPALKSRLIFSAAGALIGACMIGAFFWMARFDVIESLLAIAKNEGKHPPELDFILFSLGGAFVLLSLSIAGGRLLSRILGPITIIGKNSLSAFIFHIVVIFVFYRFLFDYWRTIPYVKALTLTLILLALTAVWVKVSSLVQERA